LLQPVYFGLDRAAVAAPERPKLQAAIKWLADNPTNRLVLVGHCDWRGTAEYNLGLGDRRANAVKQYLWTIPRCRR
jgi:peptidoglycan-associated lipoprotein